MSDLHKQMMKNKAKQFQEDSGSDEERDQFEQPPPIQAPVKLQGQKPQPIKADHNLSHHQNPQASKMPAKKIHDYTPAKWNQYFDQQKWHPNGTPIYIAGDPNELSPIFLCLHGAGHSAMAFAVLAAEVKQYATLASFDFRGHGQSKIVSDDLSAETLIADIEEILKYLIAEYPTQNFIMVGHSMGGSIATKATTQLLHRPFADKVQGLIVIDVVEGTAMEALPFMETIVNNRPKTFKCYEQAIQWSLNTMQLHTLQSARISIPDQLVMIDNRLHWKVDLMKSAAHWHGWFQGLTEEFLAIRIPKILMLAERERLDKDLTVAQMQGKFRLVVLQNTGHSIQEDDPKNTAANFNDFLIKFRIPRNQAESQRLKEVGIGKFHCEVPEYQKQH